MAKKIEVFASEAQQGELENFPDIKRGWGITKSKTGGIPPMKWYNAIQKRTDEAVNQVAKESINGYTFKDGGIADSQNDWFEHEGNFYYRKSGFPHTVEAGKTPENDGGVWSESNIGGGWVPGIDATLRGDLAKKGGGLIGIGNGLTLDSKLKSSLSAADYGFIGDITGDSSEKFTDMQRTALRAGIRVIRFPQKTSFNLEQDILLNRDAILVGNADIKTKNPNNRYLKCYPECSTIDTPDYVVLGDLSTFANALLRAKYMGEGAAKVVFLGDSITAGGQHKSDFTGMSELLKDAFVDGVGIGGKVKFYNRAISGSSISESLEKIPSFVKDPSDIRGPGEEPWITDLSRPWLSYVEDIQPDLVVVAFGMNSTKADDVKYCLALRGKLKAMRSNPSIVWVTSPMRTVDVSAGLNGNSFGAYPGNEYSNTSGMSYGAFGRYVGDTVIDVNRSSNIVMLGLDPSNCTFKPDDVGRYKTISDVEVTIDSNTLKATIPTNGMLLTQEYMRDFAVEFTPELIGGIIRVRGRSDTLSQSMVYCDLSNNEAVLYANLPNSAQLGVAARVSVNPAGKKFRMQVSGSRIYIMIDNILVIDVYDIYASRFQSNSSIQAVSAPSKISGIRFFKPVYKTAPPSLTISEIFSPAYGVGGNLLNHPNTLGMEKIYGSPMNEFKYKLRPALENNKLVKSSTNITLPPTVTGTITTLRQGNMIFIEGRDIRGSLPAFSLLGRVDIMYYPENTVYGGATVVSGDNSHLSVRVGTDGKIVLSKDLTTESNIFFAFSISTIRGN